MEIQPIQIKPTQFTFSKIIKYLCILIPLAVGGNIIYVIVGTKQEILSELGNFNVFYLLLAVLLAFVPWITQSIALTFWSRLFKKKLTPRQSLKTVMATELAGAIVPVAVGGGYVKLGMLLNYGFTASEATMITLLGTIADGVFFFLTLPLALIISGAWSHPVIRIIEANLATHWRTAAIILAGIFALIIILRRFISGNTSIASINIKTEQKAGAMGPCLRTRRFLVELIAAARFVLKNGKGTFIAGVGVLGIGWCCRYCVISALVYGLGYRVDPVLFFLLQWVVFSAATLIPSPGGIGGAELSFALVYNGLVPSGIIPILTGAWRFVTFYMIIALDALMLTFVGLGSSRNKSGNAFHDATEEIII